MLNFFIRLWRSALQLLTVTQGDPVPASIVAVEKDTRIGRMNLDLEPQTEEEKEGMRRIVEVQTNKLQERGWVVFQQDKIMDLMRRCIYSRTKPVLIVQCERSTELGAYCYEYFIPSSIGWRHENGSASICGTIGPGGARHELFWYPDRSFDKSGRIITMAYALTEYFPHKEMEEALNPLAEKACEFCADKDKQTSTPRKRRRKPSYRQKSYRSKRARKGRKFHRRRECFVRHVAECRHKCLRSQLSTCREKGNS